MYGFRLVSIPVLRPCLCNAYTVPAGHMQNKIKPDGIPVF